MSKHFNMTISKTTLVIVTIFIISQSIYPLIILNRGDEIFVDKNSPASIESQGFSIKTGIIEGAGYFLDGYAHALSFLRAVEMSEIHGVNPDELKDLVAKAVEAMTNARDTYKLLKQTADATPYNPVVIEKLMALDYDALRNTKGLNATAFAEVTAFLQKGDVRNVFGKLLSGSESLLVLLTDIQGDLETNGFPEIEKMWRINDAYADTQRFGQYAAEVFFAIGSGQ